VAELLTQEQAVLAEPVSSTSFTKGQ